MTRVERIAVLVGALAAAGSAVGAAYAYRRPDPVPPLPAPGMTVGSDRVTLVEGAPAWSLVKVAPATIAESTWSEPVPARVAFDEARASRVGSPLAGRVVRLDVERGRVVHTGDPLFVVASPALAELRADRERAFVERGTARATHARTEALVDAQAAPGKDLVSATQQLAESELVLRNAELRLATLRLGGTGGTSFTVTAPRGGVVVENSLAVGQQVDASAGAQIAIADLSVVWVVADVFESDVGAIAAGTAVRCILAGDDGTAEVPGTVEQVAGTVDPDRHTVPVRIRLPNPDGLLRPNAFAQVRFFTPSAAAISVPSAAVLGDPSYVYVEDRGILRRQPVEIGVQRHGVVPILSGLSAGQRVVVRGGILIDNEIQLDN